MRYAYTALMYLMIPALLMRLLWRARKAPDYKERWNERFGCFAAPEQITPIWLHAVSLGEVNAAIPLIKQLLNDYPDKRVLVTTTTPTGSRRVQSVFADSVEHVYLPYDFPDALDRFIKRVQAEVAIIMETELWPNMIDMCKKNNIPVLIMNARLSERSAKGYSRIRKLVQEMLEKVDTVAAQTETDAQRFIELGLSEDKVKVLGNVKFDITIPDGISEQASELRSKWGAQRPVFIAASTHDGEDEIILEAFAELKKAMSDAVLVLVPRHPERFDKVAALCREKDFHTVLRSEDSFCSDQMDIFIGNTMGELLLFYATADVAFVGGSLIPVGGHNLLEPAALSIATVTGPNMFNFTRVYQLMQDAEAVITVDNAQTLAAAVKDLFDNPQQREALAKNGLKVVEENRGAVERQMQLIKTIID